MDSDGSAIPLGALTSSDHSNYDPSIASNGSDFLVAWVNKRFKGASEKFDVLSQLVGRRGPLSAEQPLAFSAPAQRWPAKATNGKLHFVVWAEEIDAGREAVFAARYTRFGEPLDPAPFRVSESANDQSLPAIGFDGNHFLIVWMEYDRQSSPWRQPVLGRRFTSTGVPIDLVPFEIAEQTYQFFPPSVSSNGATFFVAADNQAAVVDFQDNKPVISLNRISAAGRYIRPSSAWTGSMYLAVWTRVDAGVPDWGLYGLRLSAGGFALDSLPYAIAETNASESGSVACSSGGCLAAWNNGRGIRVGRMSANGDLLDRTAEAGGSSIVDWPGNRAAWHPAIFARRDGYVVVWSTADAQGIWQLYYAELDLSGRPVAPAALLTGSGENEYPAALVFDASGLSSMVYQRLARGDLYGGVNRVFLRTPASTPRQRPAR